MDHTAKSFLCAVTVAECSSAKCIGGMDEASYIIRHMLALAEINSVKIPNMCPLKMSSW